MAIVSVTGISFVSVSFLLDQTPSHERDAAHDHRRKENRYQIETVLTVEEEELFCQGRLAEAHEGMISEYAPLTTFCPFRTLTTVVINGMWTGAVK